MQLRNGALAGGSQGQLPADRRPAFEEGVLLIFKRWTALCLALDGQWGGSNSADKAQIIYEETLDWFYKKKGEPASATHPAIDCSSSEYQESPRYSQPAQIA
jgi:pre-rRNA-processing protein TSR2